MRIFFDFEFIENGDKHPIIPVSVGLVREDGLEYYAEFSGVDWSRANEWVLENVKTKLIYKPEDRFSKERITEDIKTFVGEKPEFWAYYADYDWVLLCSLYGRMIDLPTGWPMFCLDLKQMMYHLNINDDELEELNKNPLTNTQEHHALDDAIWNKNMFNYLLERGFDG